MMKVCGLYLESRVHRLSANRILYSLIIPILLPIYNDIGANVVAIVFNNIQTERLVRMNTSVVNDYNSTEVASLEIFDSHFTLILDVTAVINTATVKTVETTRLI